MQLSRNRNIDLLNKRFGRLIVLEKSPLKGKNTKWLCKCDCGNRKLVTTGNLSTGHTQSCGCLRKEVATESNTTHGLSKSRFYQCWRDMLDRTHRKQNRAFGNYGGRGITVCNKWNSFQGFKEDMYESYLVHSEIHGEKNTTLDRIDYNGNYHFDNCRWATPKVQSTNKRSNKRFIIDGELLTAKEISEKFSLPYSTIIKRINRGWSGKQLILPHRGNVC